MSSRIFVLASALASSAFLGSCSNSTERNILVDRRPFLHERIRFDPADTDGVIRLIHRFADVNGMDFLLAKETLPEGDYNVTAAGHDLNVKAMHVGQIDPIATDIYAYARSNPTQSDKAKVTRMVCVLRRQCQS